MYAIVLKLVLSSAAVVLLEEWALSLSIVVGEEDVEEEEEVNVYYLY